jgi:hypothetical protein
MSARFKITTSVTLTTLECANCKMTFAITERFEADRRHDHKTFYCPAGHSNFYGGKTQEEKLAEELSRERQRKAELEDEVAWQRDQRNAAERRASAARGQITRLKNRAAAGVCPCCNRSFVALAKHMATKHPGFRAEEISEGASLQ